MYLDKPEGQPDEKVAWGSDVFAKMLRLCGYKYISLNPGASYRGLHDSLVNHLGNRDPGMLLCLHEEHAVGIAHGYAKATDEPMATALHSNVGLMHGHMAIFNAFCDRQPIFLIGATGPVDSHQRRPWIDWIHTSSDQAQIIRDIIKFDNQPASPEGIVDAILHANLAVRSRPSAPVYVVLDAGLGELSLEKVPEFPDMARFQPPAPPRPTVQDMDKVRAMLKEAKRPMFLFGRGTRAESDWKARVELIERLGACAMTDLKNPSVFPTDHPAHTMAIHRPGHAEVKLLSEADLIIALDWIDLAGFVSPPEGPTFKSKIVHVSMDHHLHNGAHMVYQATAPTDLMISASPDAFVADLLAATTPDQKKAPWREPIRVPFKPGDGSRIRMADVAHTLRKCFDDPDKVGLAFAHHWPVDIWPFRDPGAYMGKDGGGGVGSGPSISIGVALANADRGRPTVTVVGDGDFLMGGSAIWTAVKHKIPILIIIYNNLSFYNDELHQESMALRRNRPVSNKWIGQAVTGPSIDIAKFVDSQGGVGIGPIKDPKDLEAALRKGVEVLNSGGVCVIDVHIPPGAERGHATERAS